MVLALLELVAAGAELAPEVVVEQFAAVAPVVAVAAQGLGRAPVFLRQVLQPELLLLRTRRRHQAQPQPYSLQRCRLP